MLIVSNFLLWVVVLLQIVAIAALARRLRPAPAPQRGASDLQLVHDAGAADRSAPGEAEAAAATMVLHIAADCPVGQRLVADADLMARTAGLRFLLARGEARGGGVGGGGDTPFANTPRGRSGSRAARGDKAPGQASVPYLMIVDAAGDITAQGAVRSRPDLARLVARASAEPSSVAGA